MKSYHKAAEIDAFEKKYGHKPTEIKVAIDALAVFAHKDNPIKGWRWTSSIASFRARISAAVSRSTHGVSWA